jgi:hypothetical protein
MSGWKNTDAQANNEPSYITNIGRDRTYSNNYSNNTILVTSTRLANANSSQGVSSKQTAHIGWVNYNRGTGGRAGRVQSEVLVALSNPTSANSNAALPWFSGV